MSDSTFERQLSALRAARRRRTLIVAAIVAAALFVVLLAVPISYSVYRGVQLIGVPVTSEPSLNTALSDPRNIVVEGTEPASAPAEVAAATEPEPSPAPEPPAEPEPEREPEPEARAVAPAPQPSGIDALLRRGWDTVPNDPAGGAAQFRSALDQRPGHAEASYGYGYALLKQADPSGARPHLCTALRGGDLEVERDVRSLLAQNGLTCD